MNHDLATRPSASNMFLIRGERPNQAKRKQGEVWSKEGYSICRDILYHPSVSSEEALKFAQMIAYVGYYCTNKDKTFLTKIDPNIPKSIPKVVISLTPLAQSYSRETGGRD